MSDSRMDHALKKGDKLCCKEGTYEIMGLIGSGGMSLVYEAVLDGSNKPCALKEYDPYGQGSLRVNGVIPLTPELQTMAMHEMEMSQQASQNNRRIAYSTKLEPFEMVVDGVRYHPDGQGIFMVQEPLSHGISFNAMVQQMAMEGQRFPHIFDTLSLVQQVLLALIQCHKNGVWFGDLHPGNIIFCDVEHQHAKYGVGVLVDFGASQQLESDGKTKPLCGVCATADYAAPELMEPGVRVGPEADIYSVGVLLQNCILGPAELEGMICAPSAMRRLYEDRGWQLGCRSSAGALYELICKATAQYPEERYKTADEMLDAVGKLMESVKPPSHILPNNLSAPDYFQPGNRMEMVKKARRQLLEHGSKPLFLHGIAGIGKSETAIQIGLDLMGKDRREVYLIHWHESTRHTVESLFEDKESASQRSGLGGRHNARRNSDYLFERNLDILAREYKGTVLILDNFYQDGKGLDDLRSEDAFRRLLGLCPKISILLTTRYDTKEPQWHIDPLSEDDLLELMRHFMPYQWEEEKEEDLRKLIRQVENHTLAVSLIAKTLEAMEGDLTAAQLLEVFSNKTLEIAEMDAVTTDQDRTYKQERIYGHLKALFDYSNLSVPQLQMMAIACILPDGGMDRALLKSCLPKELNDARKALRRCGWLERRGDKIVTHPLIAQICREIEEEDTVYDFLKGLMKQCDFNQFRYERYQQLAQTAANASEHLCPLAAAYASVIYDKMGDVRRSRHYSEKALEAIESAGLHIVDPDLFEICLCNLSDAQRIGGNVKEAYEIASQALEYYRQHEKAGYFPYQIYESLVMCCLEVPDVAGAVSYMEEMKRHLETDSTADEYRKARCYTVFGDVELHRNRKEEALKQFLKAEEIYNRLPQKDVNVEPVASILAGIGACYDDSKPRKALEYLERGRDMLETWYEGVPHPGLRNFYGEIAKVYLDLGNFPKAEENIMKSLRIMEPIVGRGHPELCTEYCMLCVVYRALGKAKEELNYLKLAVEAGATEFVGPMAMKLMIQSNTPKEIAEAQEYLKRLRGRGIDTTMWEMTLRFKSGGRT